MTNAPHIDRADYEAIETAILSGQIDAGQVPAMLAADADFARWYRTRIEARGQNR